MPHTHGYAKDFPDLVNQVIVWSTDENIHGKDKWELMRNEPWPRGAILKVPGWEEGEHFYVGLMHAVIQRGVTYKDWFLKEENLATHFIWNKNGAGAKPSDKSIYINSGSIMVNDTAYYFSMPEIFETSSQALFLGAFKQYCDGLDWHEQPGGNQVKIKPKDIYYSVSGSSYPLAFTPPCYPGVGFPAIGMDYDGPIGEYIEYWITKDRNRLVLVTNNCGFWDVAYLGFLDPYHKPSEYAVPAVVIGGTSGVITVGEALDLGGSLPTPTTGFRFDYSTKNWNLSRGIPAFAAIPWTGLSTWRDVEAISQVQLLLPTGCWQSFANWLIQEEVKVEHGPTYYFGHKTPEQTTALRHYLRPTCTDIGATNHIYKTTQSNEVTYQTEPIEFVQDKADSKNIFGKLWRIYWPSSPVCRYGPQIINGKLYLVVPNSWEGRRWHIGHGRTGVVNHEALLKQDNFIEYMTRQMNCLIRLED